MVEFFLGILASLIAAAIWQAISHLTSFIPSKYPDVRGEWIGEYELNGNIVNELITVEQQFGKKIRGFFISPKIESQIVIKCLTNYLDKFIQSLVGFPFLGFRFRFNKQ